MEFNRKELKALVRQRMREQNPSTYLVSLIYLLLTIGLTALIGVTNITQIRVGVIPFLALFISILFGLYSLVMNFGYQWWTLRAFRQEQPSYQTLMDGFSMVGRVLLLNISLILRYFGWMCLVTIPGVIVLFLAMIPMSVGFFLFVYIVLLLAILMMSFWIQYRYVMAPYLLMDTEDKKIKDCVKESITMMDGWKWTYFKVQLSFLGWNMINVVLVSIVVFCAVGYAVVTMPSNLYEARLYITNIIDSGWLNALLLLIQIPVQIFLCPYSMMTTSGFYEFRKAYQPQAPASYTYQGPNNNTTL